MDRQAFGRLGLTVGTVFNAVNYLDRFLSINCHLQVRTILPISIGPVFLFSSNCYLSLPLFDDISKKAKNENKERIAITDSRYNIMWSCKYILLVHACSGGRRGWLNW